MSGSGSGFGIFSSYSAYASETLSFTPLNSSSSEPFFVEQLLQSTGSVGMSLDTSFGDLVFSGSDTVQTVFENDFGENQYVYYYQRAEQLSFVHGSDTLVFANLAAQGYNPTDPSAQTGDVSQLFSSVLTLSGAVSLPDSINAAVGSAIAIVMAANVTVGGATSTNYTLGEGNGQITYTPMTPHA